MKPIIFDTCIDGIKYTFEIEETGITFESYAFKDDKLFTLSFGPTEEQAILNLVKKIENYPK